MAEGKVLCFGELMIRLKSPGKERLLQSPILEASYGGAEANVACNLAALGDSSGFITALPEGPLGEVSLAFLRQSGVDTSWVVRSAGRMGLYFLEEGAAQRPSRVIYDRQDSAMALCPEGLFPWEEILKSAGHFHISGITPALSPQAAREADLALVQAGKWGLVRSLDLNYRKNLWKYGKSAPEVLPALAEKCEILFSNEEDLQKALGWETFDPQKEEAVLDFSRKFHSAYPRVRILTMTLRTALGADKNRWEALAMVPGTREVHRSRSYLIEPVVDRVGAGDSFAAGLIHAHLRKWSLKDSLEFATALSCLKHSIPGDQARISPAEVETLLSGDGSGRVQR